MDGLEGFLNSQRVDGELDSGGEFTISLEKARQKLREYQLVNPAFYLLKIFQAAVWGGAREIHVKLSGRVARLWFETRESVYDIAQTVAALDNILGRHQGGLHHLVVGLNSSMANTPEYVLWSEWSRHQRAFKMVGDGVELTQAPPPPAKGFPAPGWSGYLFELKKKGNLLKGFSWSVERTALETRCCYSPVPAYLNGSVLSNRWDSTQTSPRLKQLSQPFFLAERFVCDPHGRMSQAAVDRQGYFEEDGLWLRKKPSKKTFCLQFLDSRGEATEPSERLPLTCTAEYALPVALCGESKIFVVKDGVVLSPVRLTHRKEPLASLGGLAIVQGDDVEVDVSEFGVKENFAFEEVVDRAYHNWGELAATAAQKLDKLKRCPSEVEEAELAEKGRKSVASATGGGCLLPLLLGLLAPEVMGEGVYASLALAGVFGGAYFPFRKRPADRDQQLREYVLERLHRST